MRNLVSTSAAFEEGVFNRAVRWSLLRQGDSGASNSLISFAPRHGDAIKLDGLFWVGYREHFRLDGDIDVGEDGDDEEDELETRSSSSIVW